MTFLFDWARGGETCHTDHFHFEWGMGRETCHTDRSHVGWGRLGNLSYRPFSVRLGCVVCVCVCVVCVCVCVCVCVKSVYI